MTVLAFENRDPAQPGFWSERFERQFTPWERPGVPLQLQKFVEAASAPLVTLIPGCGSGRDVAFLADAGWDVCAIDFSEAAVTAARARLGEQAERVVQADFFAFTPPQPVRLVYEQAFICALPRTMWPDVIDRYATLLPAGGLLAGFFFFDPSPKGPPFGADPVQLEALLSPHFIRIEDEPAVDSIAVFAGRERWQVWQRR